MMSKPGVSGSWTTELRQPGTNAVRDRDEVGPQGSRAIALRHCSRPRGFDWPPTRAGVLTVSGRDLLMKAQRLPLRRAAFRTEAALRSATSPFCLAGVGHAGVSEARAQGAQPVGLGNRPAGFDLVELFGAVSY